jgi:hypothetical protein
MLKLDEESRKISYQIPLTTTSGKVRVKERSIVNEYGLPVATRQNKFSHKHYIEWQIGYDVVTSEISTGKSTTLKELTFVGANGKTKSLYELSEIAYHLVKWNIVSKEKLQEIHNFIKGTNDELLIDVNPDFPIKRTNLIPKQLFGINFQKAEVSYPLLIHKFGQFEVITEIIIKEKQRAMGMQPMLYLCFPITELQTKIPLLGRVANLKEFADFTFDTSNTSIALEMLKIFGILSKNHKHDILQIIDLIINQDE